MLIRVSSFLFQLRKALLYLFVFLTPSAWVLHLGILAGAKQICSAFLTLFWFQIDEACLNNNPLYWQVMCLHCSQELCWCVAAQRQKSGSRMDATPSEKMSGIIALSTQLKPKTDGSSEHCSTATTETMATVRQQEACQANRRRERSAI